MGGCTDGPSVSPPGKDDTTVDTVITDDSDAPFVLDAGALTITEFMVPSLRCPGVPGQYIEIVNTTSSTIDLGRLQISNGAATADILGGSIAGGERLLGLPASAATDCGDLEAGFTYADLLLSPEDGRVEIYDGATLIDGVDFHTWPQTPGYAWQVDVDKVDSDTNDGLDAWCPSTLPISDTLDFGSPGALNEYCAPPLPVPVSVAPAGSLVITEIMVDSQQCPAETGQYIELANIGDVSLDLSELLLSNGETNVPIGAGVVVRPGGVVWFSSGAVDNYCYRDSVIADGVWSGLTLNRRDVVSIGWGTPFRTLDAVPTEEFSHQPGLSAELSLDQWDTAFNDISDAWCFATEQVIGQTDFGTPGRRNGTCSGAGSVHVPPTLGRNLRAGDLVITEAMPNPLNCDDFDAEYFEVYNTLDEVLDLVGLRVVVGGQSVQLTTPSVYIVQPHSWAIAEYYSGATVAGCYTGLVGEFLWNTARMQDDGTSIRLESDYYVIDEVDLTQLATVPGASLQLDGRYVDPVENDDASHWCHSTRTFVGSHGDFGSPQAENDPCPDPVPDTDTDTDIEVIVPPTSVISLAAGDLIITEFMANPQDCGDFGAEYIEVYNRTDLEVDLTGLLVNVGGNQTSVNTVLSTIQPQSYGTLRYSSGPAPACYGFTANARYAAGLMNDAGTTLTLSNGRTTFDTVVFNGWADLAAARAMTLDPESTDAALNDDPAAWCQAQAPFVGSLLDWGSPGEANQDCPVVIAPTETGDTGVVGPPPVLGLADLDDGDLIITEFMANPEDCFDFAAEYIEIYNRREAAVDLTGLVVSVGGTNATLSDVGDPIESLGYALLRYTTGAPPSCYGIAYNGLYVMAPRMPDTGTTLAISGGGNRFDTVYATGWLAITPAASMELDPGWLDAATNDDASHWCVASTLFPGSNNDLGSPGAENTSCAPAPVVTIGPSPLDPSTPGLPIVDGQVGPFLGP